MSTESLLRGARIRRAVAALAAVTASFTGSAAQAAQLARNTTDDAPFVMAHEVASADVRYAAHWIMRHGDNQNRPFAIVDKKGARLFVFSADGNLEGASSALLGLGIGDESIPDIAQRDNASLLPEERTTPAGRFASEPGQNLKGEDIVWVDYDARLAIHRLRPDASHDLRARKLASSALQDKRVSLGCVVVPVAFYETVVMPMLGRNRGVVYVLPESRPVQSMFADLQWEKGGL